MVVNLNEGFAQVGGVEIILICFDVVAHLAEHSDGHYAPKRVFDFGGYLVCDSEFGDFVFLFC